MNSESSRSHTILTLTVKGTKNGLVQTSCLNLIDLAGSENQSSSKASNATQLGEACKINLSLTYLGSLLRDVATGKGFINYRNSKLTLLLKDSIGGNAKTCVIATVNPASAYRQQTLSTLKFASHLKYVRNSAVRNLSTSNDAEAWIKESKRLEAKLKLAQDEIASLKAEAAEAADGFGGTVSSMDGDAMSVESPQQSRAAAREIRGLKDQVLTMQERLVDVTEELARAEAALHQEQVAHKVSKRAAATELEGFQTALATFQTQMTAEANKKSHAASEQQQLSDDNAASLKEQMTLVRSLLKKVTEGEQTEKLLRSEIAALKRRADAHSRSEARQIRSSEQQQQQAHAQQQQTLIQQNAALENELEEMTEEIAQLTAQLAEAQLLNEKLKQQQQLNETLQQQLQDQSEVAQAQRAGAQKQTKKAAEQMSEAQKQLKEAARQIAEADKQRKAAELKEEAHEDEILKLQARLRAAEAAVESGSKKQFHAEAVNHGKSQPIKKFVTMDRAPLENAPPAEDDSHRRRKTRSSTKSTDSPKPTDFFTQPVPMSFASLPTTTMPTVELDLAPDSPKPASPAMSTRSRASSQQPPSPVSTKSIPSGRPHQPAHSGSNPSRRLPSNSVQGALASSLESSFGMRSRSNSSSSTMSGSRPAVAQLSASEMEYQRSILQSIQGEYDGDVNLAAVPSRRFVLDGNLQRVQLATGKRLEYHFFLLSDLLVYSKPVFKKLKHGRIQRYRMHRALLLALCRLVDIPDGPDLQHAFKVNSPQKTIVIACGSAGMKEQWLQEMSVQIECAIARDKYGLVMDDGLSLDTQDHVETSHVVPTTPSKTVFSRFSSLLTGKQRPDASPSSQVRTPSQLRPAVPAFNGDEDDGTAQRLDFGDGSSAAVDGNGCPLCLRSFNAMFRRKHSCSRCASAVCANCSTHKADAEGDHSTVARATRSAQKKHGRLCDACHGQVTGMLAPDVPVLFKLGGEPSATEMLLNRETFATTKPGNLDAGDSTRSRASSRRPSLRAQQARSRQEDQENRTSEAYAARSSSAARPIVDKSNAARALTIHGLQGVKRKASAATVSSRPRTRGTSEKRMRTTAQVQPLQRR